MGWLTSCPPDLPRQRRHAPCRLVNAFVGPFKLIFSRIADKLDLHFQDIGRY